MQTMQATIAAPRKPFLRNSFVVGVVVSVLVAVADVLLTRAGMGRNLSRLAFMGAIDVVIVWLLAEPWRPSLRTMTLFVGGGLLGAGYFLANYAREQIHISASSPVDYIYYFASAVLIAPIFEEAVVRRLMFFGAAEWMGAVASAILVSALFAVTHSAIPVFAFGFSLGLCFLAWRGVKTLDRAVFHGSYNLILQGLFVCCGS